MVINLNPGADSTLVNVAYRAAMANAPKDYSDTLERAADSYEKTMEASSEMWGNVAKVGAALGGEMVKNANERAAYATKAETLNPEDAEFLLSEIYGNKDAQRELGLLPGVFGSRETKKELAKLKMEQQELFAEIDLAAASIKAGTDAVASGAFDTRLAMNDGEMVNAIIKSGLKNRVTDNKNIAKLSRDEETGDLIYTLYNVENNPDGEVLIGDDGKPRTMTIRQFNESIATNVDDKGVMAAGFNKYNDQVADRGFKSRTGVYDEQMRAVDSNWLDTQLGDKPVNLKRAMHMTFGYSDTSFFDDITKNKNEYSAALYADLLKATGGGDVLTGAITDGMKDTDGEEGISAREAMDADNYKLLTANLLGMKDPEVTKALFKDYTLKEFEKANNYGHSNKAPKPGSGSGTDGNGDPWGFGSKQAKIPGTETYVSREDRTRRRNHIKNNEGFRGHFGDYKWDNEVGGYILEGNTEEPLTKWKVMQQEAIVGNTDRQVDFDSLGIQKSQTALNSKGEETAGGVTLDLLDGDDNTVADSLNSYIPKNSNYSFRPKTSGSFWDPRGMFDVFAGEDLVRNAVELVDGDGKPIMWKGEKLVLFTSSGGGMETATKNAQDAAVANFNDWLGQQNDFELQTGGNTGVGASEPEDVN